MPAFVEVDERTPLDTQMEEKVGPVILITSSRLSRTRPITC
jgi:hypothetical protein